MNKNKLKEFFSEFWQIDSHLVKDELKLNSENLKSFNSIRTYQFFAAVESNFNVSIHNIEKIRTFKDLHDNLCEV